MPPGMTYCHTLDMFMAMLFIYWNIWDKFLLVNKNINKLTNQCMRHIKMTVALYTLEDDGRVILFFIGTCMTVI